MNPSKLDQIVLRALPKVAIGLNALVILSAEGALRFDMKSRIDLVMSANCWPVLAGKISRKASLIGLRMAIKALKAFENASIKAVRPPAAAQSFNIWLRALAECWIIPPRTLETLV